MPMSMTNNKLLTESFLPSGLKDLLSVYLFSIYLLSCVDIVIHYIAVYFTFWLLDYVCCIKEFVLSKFIILRLYSIHFIVILAGT